VIAVGPAIPISARSQLGVPVGVQANLRQALTQGEYDVVHGFEPGLPSLSYLALRDTGALSVATFVSPNRLGYPPARSQREVRDARQCRLEAVHDVEAAVRQRDGEVGLHPDRDADARERGTDRDEVLHRAARECPAAGGEVARTIRRRQHADAMAAGAQGAGEAVDVLVDLVRLRPGEGRDEGDRKCHPLARV